MLAKIDMDKEPASLDEASSSNNNPCESTGSSTTNVGNDLTQSRSSSGSECYIHPAIQKGYIVEEDSEDLADYIANWLDVLDDSEAPLELMRDDSEDHYNDCPSPLSGRRSSSCSTKAEVENYYYNDNMDSISRPKSFDSLLFDEALQLLDDDNDNVSDLLRWTMDGSAFNDYLDNIEVQMAGANTRDSLDIHRRAIDNKQNGEVTFKQVNFDLSNQDIQSPPVSPTTYNVPMVDGNYLDYLLEPYRVHTPTIDKSLEIQYPIKAGPPATLFKNGLPRKAKESGPVSLRRKICKGLKSIGGRLFRYS